MIEPFRGNLVIPFRHENGVEEVLVGRKKTGMFLGNIVFPGGKAEYDKLHETPAQAAARELEEETAIKRDPAEVSRVGTLFTWGDRFGWVAIFATDVTGESPQETRELIPEWRRTGSPDFYDDMPADVPLWFDAVAGEDEFRIHTVWRDGELVSSEMESPEDHGVFHRYLNLTDARFFV